MAAPFTLESFKAAVLASLDSRDGSKQAAAQRWMTEFNLSNEAWTVADNALATIGFTKEEAPIAFNAALILHQKIKYAYADLRPEIRVSFRDRILHHVMRFKPDKAAGKDTYATYTRLCLVMATMAVQMEEWVNAVQSFVDMMNSKLLDMSSLLRILTFLPEEAVVEKLNMSVAVRRAFQDELEACAPNVLALLASQMEAARSDVVLAQRIFQCLAAWVKYCRVRASVMVASPLLGATFAAVEVPQLFDDAIECLIAMVNEYYHFAIHSSIIHVLLREALKLAPMFEAAMKSGDDDVCRGLCRMFSDMGEMYVSVILNEEPFGQDKLVSALLLCTSHTDAEISSITFRFWEYLADSFEHMPISGKKDRQRAILHPTLEATIPVLIQAAQFPEDFATLASDKQITFRRRFRFEVTDVMEQVATVLGTEVVLGRIAQVLAKAYEAFTGAVAAARASHTPISDSCWRPLEACLFCVRGVAPQVPLEEAKVLPGVMALLEQLPDHVELRTTSLRLIGRYADWIARQPALPAKCFEFVVRGMEVFHPVASEAAADSFSYMCDFCADQLGQLPLDCLPRLKLAEMTPKQVAVVVEGLGYTLSKSTPEARAARFQQLMDMFVAQLKTAVEAAVRGATPDSKKAVTSVLLHMKTLVANTSVVSDAGEQHPVVPFLARAWATLDAALAALNSSPTVVSSFADFHRAWLLQADASAAGIMQPLLKTVMDNARAVLDGNLLYIVGSAAKVWGKHPAHHAALMACVTELCGLAMTKLSGSPTAFDDNPDLVLDLFLMLWHILDCLPHPMLASPLMEPLLQCALAAMALEHHRANSCVMSFLGKCVHLVDNEATRPAAAALLGKHAQSWVNRVFQLIMGGVPRHVVDSEEGSFGKLLFRLGEKDAAGLAAWMTPCMEAIPVTVITADEKVDFMRRFAEDLATGDAKGMRRFMYTLVRISERCWMKAKGAIGGGRS